MEIPRPSPASPEPAAAVYAARVAALQSTETRLQREHIQLGYVRLVFALAAVVLLFPPIPFLVIPLFGFGLAARAHGTVLGRLAATRRALAFYARAQTRQEGQWAELSSPQPKVDLSTSLFAEDLDLFGPGSLFALLCETRTSLGRDTLAQWLLQPASPEKVRARQSAVAELRGRVTLREAFASAPGPPDAPLDREALAAWVRAGFPGPPHALAWLAPMLVLLTLLAAWRFAVVHSPLLLVPMLMLNGAITFRFRKYLNHLFLEAEGAGRALRTAAHLAAEIEKSSFEAAWLQQGAAALEGQDLAASRAVAQLQTLAQWTEARGNYLIRLLDVPLLYSLQLGLALKRWHTQFGPSLIEWLDHIASIEALLSLAAYSFEHPADPFPEIIPTPEGQYVSEGLGHPLLPEGKCIRNDVTLDSKTRILLVSGSNMSGKSTLLRSVGVNAVLAFAGAPVRARRLVLSPVALAASIHVNDSLQAGRSRFYAEIVRLRAIAEMARQNGPVLFLVDELLAGTNSSDRLAGAQGLLRLLLQCGALGLLSTHDLALTALGADASDRIHNVHLEDEVVDGELRFDYTLRDGPVTRSNGVALMRLIGLDV